MITELSVLKRIMTMKPDTVLIDKYGESEFTVKEISALVVAMIHTDTKEDIEKFCERFVVKTAGDADGECRCEPAVAFDCVGRLFFFLKKLTMSPHPEEVLTEIDRIVEKVLTKTDLVVEKDNIND